MFKFAKLFEDTKYGQILLTIEVCKEEGFDFLLRIRFSTETGSSHYDIKYKESEYDYMINIFNRLKQKSLVIILDQITLR